MRLILIGSLAVLVSGGVVGSLPGVVAAASPSGDLEQAVATDDLGAIRAMGPGVLPRLARLYSASAPARRARIASLFFEAIQQRFEVR